MIQSKRLIHLLLLSFIATLVIVSCNKKSAKNQYIVSTDVDNFWIAFDAISAEKDSLQQLQLLDSLYLQPGTFGLKSLMQVRNYQPQEYIELIKKYPKFLSSIRANTQDLGAISNQMAAGIEKLKNLYPELSPAKIYFTVGAMRTNGTTLDSAVLIGSELALASANTDISEFSGKTHEWLSSYFATNPKENIVLLNVHEYVHTQQNEIPHQLLYQVLYEGIAEFISTLALSVPSTSPAIEFGQTNPEVLKKFEEEMFFEKTHEWLWSNYPNQFGVRDLGYYVGYEFAQRYYQNAQDKSQAIADLLHIDYSQPQQVDSLINSTQIFSRPVSELRTKDAAKRPKIISSSVSNSDTLLPTDLPQLLTFQFAENMKNHRIDVFYGPQGEDAFPEITNQTWNQDSTSYQLEVRLQPDMQYQFVIQSHFASTSEIPMMPYTVAFSTAKMP